MTSKQDIIAHQNRAINNQITFNDFLRTQLHAKGLSETSNSSKINQSIDGLKNSTFEIPKRIARLRKILETFQGDRIVLKENRNDAMKSMVEASENCIIELMMQGSGLSAYLKSFSEQDYVLYLKKLDKEITYLGFQEKINSISHALYDGRISWVLSEEDPFLRDILYLDETFAEIKRRKSENEMDLDVINYKKMYFVLLLAFLAIRDFDSSLVSNFMKRSNLTETFIREYLLDSIESTEMLVMNNVGLSRDDYVFFDFYKNNSQELTKKLIQGYDKKEYEKSKYGRNESLAKKILTAFYRTMPDDDKAIILHGGKINALSTDFRILRQRLNLSNFTINKELNQKSNSEQIKEQSIEVKRTGFFKKLFS